MLPGPTLPCPPISVIDDLWTLLLPTLPLAEVLEAPWLWPCKRFWDCAELNKALIETSWLVSWLGTWFLEGAMVGGPGRRLINGREGKCWEFDFCWSMNRKKTFTGEAAFYCLYHDRRHTGSSLNNESETVLKFDIKKQRRFYQQDAHPPFSTSKWTF